MFPFIKTKCYFTKSTSTFFKRSKQNCYIIWTKICINFNMIILIVYNFKILHETFNNEHQNENEYIKIIINKIIL